MIKLTICILAALLPAAASADPVALTDAPDPYVHRQTGFRFPALVGDFQRDEVTRYDDEGSDTGVGYQLIRDGRKLAYISVSVYPIEPVTRAKAEQRQATNCAAEFNTMKTSIIGHEPSARLLREEKVPSPSPVFSQLGHLVVYEDGLARFDGRAEAAMHEEARPYCYAGGRWLVSYRMTWPQGDRYEAEAQRFMTALAWTPKLAH